MVSDLATQGFRLQTDDLCGAFMIPRKDTEEIKSFPSCTEKLRRLNAIQRKTLRIGRGSIWTCFSVLQIHLISPHKASASEPMAYVEPLWSLRSLPKKWNHFIIVQKSYGGSTPYNEHTWGWERFDLDLNFRLPKTSLISPHEATASEPITYVGLYHPSEAYRRHEHIPLLYRKVTETQRHSTPKHLRIGRGSIWIWIFAPQNLAASNGFFVTRPKNVYNNRSSEGC